MCAGATRDQQDRSSGYRKSNDLKKDESKQNGIPVLRDGGDERFHSVRAVGQVANLRPIGDRPGLRSVIAEAIDNRPQITNLPHLMSPVDLLLYREFDSSRRQREGL